MEELSVESAIPEVVESSAEPDLERGLSYWLRICEPLEGKNGDDIEVSAFLADDTKESVTLTLKLGSRYITKEGFLMRNAFWDGKEVVIQDSLDFPPGGYISRLFLNKHNYRDINQQQSEEALQLEDFVKTCQHTAEVIRTTLGMLTDEDLEGYGLSLQVLNYCTVVLDRIAAMANSTLD